MELEVGMYVRTRQGKIDRLIGKEIATNKYGYCYDFYWYIFENTVCIDCEDYIKEGVEPSHNPIDLIEVGDYVNESLIAMTTVKIGGNCVIASNGLAFNNDDIKSIVTKEQFESVSYKLGKED